MSKFLKIFLTIVVLAISFYLVFRPMNFGPPSPRISVGDIIVPTAQGTYCWDGLFNSRCVDMISPRGIIEHQEIEPTIVPPESHLTIQFKSEPKKDSLGANLWNSEEQAKNVKIIDNVLIAPKEKGIYVYDIYAAWEKGTSSYAFIIEVR